MKYFKDHDTYMWAWEDDYSRYMEYCPLINKGYVVSGRGWTDADVDTFVTLSSMFDFIAIEEVEVLLELI